MLEPALTQEKIAVLFVCLGNICRSPLAEAAFRREAARAGLTVRVDSAGTGDWHIGAPPDPRARAEALRHGIDISAYRGRQVEAEDFLRFDRIVAMDGNNLASARDGTSGGNGAFVPAARPFAGVCGAVGGRSLFRGGRRLRPNLAAGQRRGAGACS